MKNFKFFFSMLSNLLSEYKINFYRKTTPKMKSSTGYSIYKVQRKIIDSSIEY